MTGSTSEPPAAGGLALLLAAEARRLGFVAFGICAADAAPEAGARLRRWLADGCHAGMVWMEHRADERAHPRRLWPEVRSVVVVGLPYTPDCDPLASLARPQIGAVSVYARGRDYHEVVKPRLKALARFLAARRGASAKVFCDTAPVMEKPLAEAAGLGWQGKHSNLVSRQHGNWLFLGALYTSLDLDGWSEPGAVGACGSCTRCIEACPTGAIVAPYRVDARLCISYLTIEHRGPVPEALRPLLGNRIYGCDDCLAVCPWNRFARAPADPALAPRAALAAPRLEALLRLDDPAFRALFAGSPIKRSGRDRLVRNCAYAAGNSGDPALLPALAPLLDDGDPAVADAARWATAQLTGAAPPPLAVRPPAR